MQVRLCWLACVLFLFSFHVFLAFFPIPQSITYTSTCHTRRLAFYFLEVIQSTIAALIKASTQHACSSAIYCFITYWWHVFQFHLSHNFHHLFQTKTLPAVFACGCDAFQKAIHSFINLVYSIQTNCVILEDGISQKSFCFRLKNQNIVWLMKRRVHVREYPKSYKV